MYIEDRPKKRKNTRSSEQTRERYTEKERRAEKQPKNEGTTYDIVNRKSQRKRCTQKSGSQELRELKLCGNLKAQSFSHLFW